ncbi:MAG: alpha/beta fold hydrolase [Anaerolineae bacterium]|nr:alpha/beta fold hydrolase [Anaerolineae bacterium]
MKKLGMLLALLLVLTMGTAAAQDAGEITLVPINDSGYGISTLVPEGWTQAALGVYARASEPGDSTLLAQQAAPIDAAQTMTALLPQLGLTEAPESIGTQETAALNWTLYKIDVPSDAFPVTIDLAMSESEGKTYVILLAAPTAEYETLHEAIFLPVLAAFAPLTLETDTSAIKPYTEEAVTFPNGEITLAGTLSLPESEGLHPAVVLISGSGPQDRDESLAPVAGIKPFALIADALTRAGIAVLRYDDRGVGESTGDFASATSADFMTDAAAAIDYLRGRADINLDQIGVLGHSEGGLIAAMLGANNPNVAFIVSMAGTAVTGREILVLQTELISRANGTPEEQIIDQVRLLQDLTDAVTADELENAEEIIYQAAVEQIAVLPEAQRASIGDVETYARNLAQQQLAQYTSPWFSFFLTYDPAEDWAKTTVPVLAVFGALDMQVPDEQNAPPFEAAMQAAGNTDYTVVILPDANHLMQAAVTGGSNEYATLEQEFTADFLPTVTAWILERVDAQAAS